MHDLMQNGDRIRTATPPHGHVNNAALAMLLVPLLTAICPVWYVAKTTETHRWLATFLLLLPTLLAGFGGVSLLRVLQRPVLLTLAITGFDAVKNVLVAVYFKALEKPLSSDILYAASKASLLIGILLAFLVYRLTSWIMNHASSDHSSTHVEALEHKQSLREGVMQQLLRHRFLSICGLLVAYLHLLLFLTFAIAFDDRATSGRSIERLVRRPPDSTNVQGRTSEPARGGVHLFLFREGSADLRCTTDFDTEELDPKFFEPDTPFQWLVSKVRDRYPLHDDKCANELNETSWNLRAIHTLETEVEALFETHSFDRYRGIIVAHASDKAPRLGFASNYELSRARADQLLKLVEDRILVLRTKAQDRPPLNIEWLVVPSGTSSSYLGPDDRLKAKLEDGHLSQDLSAEIQFVAIPGHLTALQRESLDARNATAESDLQLLDYIYFMVTLGTANDLAPATGFVQFVATAGHVFQLFFFVVAFNVILAIQREPLIDHGSSSGGTSQ